MKTKLKFSALLCVLCVSAFILVRASETVPQTQTILKSYFNPTGATPGTNEFNEFIDTMFWLANQEATNALAAAASAQQAISVSKAALTMWVPPTTSSGWMTLSSWTNLVQIEASNNFGGIQFSNQNQNLGGMADFYLKFSTATATTNYAVFTSVSGAGASLSVKAKSTNQIVFSLMTGGTGGSGGNGTTSNALFGIYLQ